MECACVCLDMLLLLSMFGFARMLSLLFVVGEMLDMQEMMGMSEIVAALSLSESPPPQPQVLDMLGMDILFWREIGAVWIWGKMTKLGIWGG